MRQEDLDKLTKRVVRILRDMLPPGADYRAVMIVAERNAEGVNLSLGTNADADLAAALCEMAMGEYASRMPSSIDTERLLEAVHHVLEIVLERRNAVAEEETWPPTSVTRH
jgi:hypothetical protein